jgi:hypothetical protein
MVVQVGTLFNSSLLSVISIHAQRPLPVNAGVACRTSWKRKVSIFRECHKKFPIYAGRCRKPRQLTTVNAAPVLQQGTEGLNIDYFWMCMCILLLNKIYHSKLKGQNQSQNL